jgi:hypothetical protein
MRTGKLTISRGHEVLEQRLGTRTAAPPPVAAPVSFSPQPPQSELHLINVRLNALERLTRLVEQGTLSLDEFRIEKSLILRLTNEELLLTQAAPPPPRHKGPSLASRMLGWRSLAVATVGGLALSFWAQPDETIALLSQTAQLVGG